VMSDRDELAKAAMQGLLAGDPYMIWKDGRLQIDKVAELADEMAEAMLRIRAPKKPIPTPMPSHGTPKTQP
jgi:hypothetical protein